MKNSPLINLVKGSILNSASQLEKLARKTKWLIRKPRKLQPIQFIHGLLHSVSQGDCSFRLLATTIGMRLDERHHPNPNETSLTEFDTISKPALWERVNESAVEFVKATLAQLIKGGGTAPSYTIPTIPTINRIVVEDSALLNLNENLADQFPATSNQHGVGAGLRFQAAFDLISGEPIRIDLTRYGRNDQAASADIIPMLEKGDLLIRDLGYYVNEPFNAVVEKQAHYLSRHLGARAIFHRQENGGEKIDLLKHLQKHAPNPGEVVDLDIVMGGGQKGAAQVNCRLVARRVPPEVEAKRLRRINQDEKRLNKTRSKVHKKLQGWEIYITSLPREGVGAGKIFELYPLRWRIEIIFKACKSYTPMEAIAAHRSNANHVQVLIYAWLCLLVLATQTKAFALAKPLKGSRGSLRANYLSLLKVVPKVIRMLNMALTMSCAPINQLVDRMSCQIEYHDRYERRTKRTCMAEMTEKILGLDPSQEVAI